MKQGSALLFDSTFWTCVTRVHHLDGSDTECCRVHSAVYDTLSDHFRSNPEVMLALAKCSSIVLKLASDTLWLDKDFALGQ